MFMFFGGRLCWKSKNRITDISGTLAHKLTYWPRVLKHRLDVIRLHRALTKRRMQYGH
jgi:hypothetical protein